MITNFRGKYFFLSNFYPCKVIYKAQEYPSSEHAFQAAKTHNLDQAQRIRLAKTPAIAKKLGKRVDLREDWATVCVKVMYQILQQKFANEDLQKKLLATFPHKLVEGNYWCDNFWGKCFCLKCDEKKGLNKLGKLLMRVREELTIPT